jgi:hypothetical protein
MFGIDKREMTWNDGWISNNGLFPAALGRSQAGEALAGSNHSEERGVAMEEASLEMTPEFPLWD